ncbi:LAQU0S01e00584g1_1 [Lachancea quebecensis]|uniref:LAQU0S01e00584g1_1 n=1 Tax=Lachancea quebecensis TaxID=1654605 RepID=A0A0P1KLF9_9SACH|nr:LAQU0S01e00584g1_1 [Lachancea quebecensis]
MVKQNLNAFFGPQRLYFVCGKVYKDASYANRLVHWFVQHKLPVVPVTPTGGEVDLQTDSATKNVARVKALPISKSINEGLQSFHHKDLIDGISICFVTPPKITLSILKQLKTEKAPVRSVWFQPGSWDMKCVKNAEEELQIEGSKIINDCILVNGDSSFTPSSLTGEV